MNSGRRSLELLPLSLFLLGCFVLRNVCAAPPMGSLAVALNNASKIVIDVDAGADDAVALLMALGNEAKSGWPKVVAVTCVNGNTNINNVVTNVFRTLNAVGRLDIPVFAGASRSLLYTPPSDDYFGKDGFGDSQDVPAGNYTELHQKEHAVNALIRLVEENPGELTLLCLGPLTNVALAELLHPGFVGRLGDLVVLGGSVEGRGNVRPAVEFNFHMDPEAVHVVLEAAEDAKKPLLLIPWETVKLRTSLPLSWRMDTLGAIRSPAVSLLNKAEALVLQRAMDSKMGWESADAVAAAAALRPRLVTNVSAPLHGDVEVHGTSGRATLQVDYGAIHKNRTNMQLVLSIDLEGYKKLLLDTLSA